MKSMRKFLAIVLILVMALALSACGNSDGDESKTKVNNSDLPLSGEHFVIAVNAENAPMESVDPSGEYVGFSVDLADALAEKLGFTYEWNDMEFFGLISSIQEGKADMILSSISATEERREKVDFSDAYFTSVYCIISGEDSGIETIADLKGKKVGAATGTLFEKYAQSIEGVDYVSFDSTVPAIEIIGTKELDAIIESSSYGERYAAGKNLKVSVIPKKTIDSSGAFGDEGLPGYSIAFPKGSDETVALFNEAIAELEEEGFLDGLRRNYLGDDYYEKYGEFIK